MKQISSLKSGRYRVVLVLLLCLILMAGCSTESGVPDQEQDGIQIDEMPQDPEEQLNDEEPESIGLINFQTQDIYGNPVSQDIFREYSLTLVNVWGTFCGPCLDEMPDLGKLQKEYEPKGVNIVGIVVDVQDENMEIVEEQRELAGEIASGTGADYTHLLVSEEMIKAVLNRFDAIPASFFVDSDGNIVSEFYIGSRDKKAWADLIDKTLESLKQQE
ncbi:MAG: TlpA disulfide reductase family protein [Eubacteriales bacterium]|nr:TlpA disulfide reductase family protein [Eubacteriales bacterium]